MTSTNSQDPFNSGPMWGNTPSNGAASFDDLTPYPPPLNPPSSSRDTTHRGRQPSAPRAPAVPPQQLNTGLPQDYHLNPGWSPGSDSTPVSAGAGRHPSRSGSHSGQKPYNKTSPTQPLFASASGRPRRSSSQSQHYDPPEGPPPTQAQEDTQMLVDPISGSQQRQQPPLCLIPHCTYQAFFNVAEEELSEYCGQGHELQAIETGFVKPCAMCKGRPRRTNERVCGPVCRERERLAQTVHGSYYGAQVIRREPRR